MYEADGGEAVAEGDADDNRVDGGEFVEGDADDNRMDGGEVDLPFVVTFLMVEGSLDV